MCEAEESLPPGFYDQPVLVVDLGAHTAIIKRADVDAAGRFAVTGSDDKTVRVWSLADGALLRTIRLPAGPGHVGKAFSVAIDPAGEIIAVGGWTEASPTEGIYLYDLATGALRQRIGGLPEVVLHLAFGPGGRHLAATLGRSNGLRVFDCDQGWAEVARDSDYGESSYGAAFAPDGRLATVSHDGQVRLYGADFRRLHATQLPDGSRPFGIAFSSSGQRLAIGFTDSTAVALLDGRSLAPLYEAASAGIDNGELCTVAWAAGVRLLAAGRYQHRGGGPVVTWADGGRGAPQLIAEAQNTVMSLLPLPGGDILVAAQDPFLGRFGPAGEVRWTVPSPVADLREQQASLAVAVDGTTVDFGFEGGGEAPMRFDIGRLALTLAPSADGWAARPRQQGLPVADWENSTCPTLAGAPLRLEPYEKSRSLAIHPDGRRFVLGNEWSLRAFDACGTPLWRQRAPSVAWTVNVTGDGRLVVAAYGDGTIRWHRMDDGREILAFMPLLNRRDWVAWTPEGFFAASPGAHGVLRWHVNQPGWQPAREFAVADIPGFHRPEAIRLVLQEMETPRAIGLAIVAEQREKVRLLTNSRLPPGARLHVVAVGISEYDPETAAHLRLRFADHDAHDVMSALAGTQGALYAPGYRETPRNEDATGEIILRALANMQAATQSGDLAVFHFSGHGARIGEKLYLLPRDVRPGDAVALQRSALPIGDLRDALMRIAERGRVLVLLDACYSGGASLDGGAQPAASRVLSTALAAANICVLTSSSGSQASREDPAWQNGAFTEAVLEALGAADTDHDGLISATELARYVDRRVRNLTNGAQEPGIELRFDGTLFAVPLR
ncbi:caspase family protein [Roseomonas sp. HJA6]|uniref:Caspase family protein n=1 Tax=Roseomonas alba TaxID=2846776 RepID=A0ABS7A402_9PROT|nr:caspase family protein [Neoroseomonas alba]MBW6397014.1 caspase family protein [Neoroseomonas alba]